MAKGLASRILTADNTYVLNVYIADENYVSVGRPLLAQCDVCYVSSVSALTRFIGSSDNER